FERLPHRRRVEQLRLHELQRDVAPERQIARRQDEPHASVAEPALDAILPREHITHGRHRRGASVLLRVAFGPGRQRRRRRARIHEGRSCATVVPLELRAPLSLRAAAARLGRRSAALLSPRPPSRQAAMGPHLARCFGAAGGGMPPAERAAGGEARRRTEEAMRTWTWCSRLAAPTPMPRLLFLVLPLALGGCATSVPSAPRPSPKSAPATPSNAHLLDDVRQVSAGTTHTCALRADGSVWCWGDNSVGQLGDGSLQSSSTPVRVRALPPARCVSAGARSTCAAT